jgi:hypothetical protein
VTVPGQAPRQPATTPPPPPPGCPTAQLAHTGSANTAWLIGAVYTVTRR